MRRVRVLGRVFAFALVLCACAAPEAGTDRSEVEVPKAAFRATVERVIDGDTFDARRSGRSVRVRLIGVNAPEAAGASQPADCFGREAEAGLRALLPPGTTVRASFQGEQHQDRFGRDLWDVWLEDGRFLQAVLVQRGYVRARTYRPHDRYAGLLAEAHDRAGKTGAGLHGACPAGS